MFFGPIYPTISIDQVSDIIDIITEAGVSSIMIDCFRLKPGIKNHVCSKLNDYQDIFTCFSKNLFRPQNYYKNLRECILYTAQEKKLNVIDAFEQ